MVQSLDHLEMEVASGQHQIQLLTLQSNVAQTLHDTYTPATVSAMATMMQELKNATENTTRDICQVCDVHYHAELL